MEPLSGQQRSALLVSMLNRGFKMKKVSCVVQIRKLDIVFISIVDADW